LQAYNNLEPQLSVFKIGLSVRKDSKTIDVEAKGALDYAKLRHTISDQKYSDFPLKIQGLLYLPGQNYCYTCDKNRHGIIKERQVEGVKT
jgi:hypothetical protein